jgi:hypothetical protein
VLQPPQKQVTKRADIIPILLYSARKKRAKIREEYSTLYPETSSASASGRSKGVLLVSASAIIKKINDRGRRYQPNHPFIS